MFIVWNYQSARPACRKPMSFHAASVLADVLELRYGQVYVVVDAA